MSVYISFSGIEDQFAARAFLIGACTCQLLHARTRDALDAVRQVGDIVDWREDFADSFRGFVDDGLIRTDTCWSRGTDTTLKRITCLAYTGSEEPRIQKSGGDDEVPL